MIFINLQANVKNEKSFTKVPMQETETVHLPKHSSHQCISCARRDKKEHRKGKVRLSSFPAVKIPEFYLTHEILIPQRMRICSVCRQKMDVGEEIQIPTKTVSIKKVDSELIWTVLNRVAKWKQKLTKYQTMTDKQFEQMGH